MSEETLYAKPGRVSRVAGAARTSAIDRPEDASALFRFSDVAAADTDEALVLGTCRGSRVEVNSKPVALVTSIQRRGESAARVRRVRSERWKFNAMRTRFNIEVRGQPMQSFPLQEIAGRAMRTGCEL